MEVFMKIDDILVIVFLLVSLFAIYKIIRCCVRYIRRYGFLAFIIGIALLAGAVAGIAWAIDRYINIFIPIICVFVIYYIAKSGIFASSQSYDEKVEEYGSAEYVSYHQWMDQEREDYEKHFGNKE